MLKKRDVKKIHYSLGCALDESCKIDVLKTTFKRRVGYDLNLDTPKTFNEKIMWLKLYYQNPLITKCSDKYAVKDYVKDVIGEQYVVPTLARYNSPEEIDFESFTFVRVDFYEIDENQIYVGEMTFYTGGGLNPIFPRQWDEILGEKIKLPEKLITDKVNTLDRMKTRGKKWK